MPQQVDDVNMELPDFTDVLQEAEQTLKECFQQYKLDEVFLSFNGGKDCTALLDITINVLRDLYKRDDIVKQLKVVYIRPNASFDEMEKFVKEIESHYGTKLTAVEGNLKDTLTSLLADDRRLKACLMGTRRTDPHSSNLKSMQFTDGSWPQMMRVFPLLDWSYHQIWSYILRRKVPYCCLYDQGYTSIGSTQNTYPNPSLATKDTEGRLAYQPAWRLAEASLERAGRVSNLNKTDSNGHTNEESKNGSLRQL